MSRYLMERYNMEQYAPLLKEDLKEHLVVMRTLQYEMALPLAARIADASAEGQTILVCGNGGSAADAQHFAAELVNRYEVSRKHISAVALTADSAVLTSGANDFGYNEVFQRQVRAHSGHTGLVIGISTSGKSESVINALVEAGSYYGIPNVLLTGIHPPMMYAASLHEAGTHVYNVPSAHTPRIQEAHGLLLHMVCRVLDAMLTDDLDPEQTLV